jgi:hypothetical protein
MAAIRRQWSVAKDEWTRIRAWVSLMRSKKDFVAEAVTFHRLIVSLKKGPIPGKCKRQLGKGPTTEKCSELSRVLLLSHDLHTNGPRY